MTMRLVKILCVALLLSAAGCRMLCAQTNANPAAEGAANAAMAGATNVAAGRTNAPAPAPVPAPLAKVGTNPAPPAKPRSETVITNAGPAVFDFANHRVLYRDHVLVDAPDFKLRCEWLAANLPQAGGQVTNIVARTNVVIDATDASGRKIHATADKAVYAYGVQNGLTNETVTLTNNVIVIVTNLDHSVITQTGPAFVWNRVTDQFIAPGGRTAFQQNVLAPAADTNSPAEGTNRIQAGTNALSAPN